jgi:hypothetical protein
MTKPLRVRPVVFVWSGEHMVPLPRFKRLCDQQFAINEEYPLVIVENRSMASHNHYFAALHEGYMNLAEEYAQEFVNEDHLRSWCLCKAGFCTTEIQVFDTPADARKFRMTFKRHAPLAIIKVEGNIVTIYEPESQSITSMKKERFEASKVAVLDLVASMARTTAAELKKNAGRSA